MALVANLVSVNNEVVIPAVETTAIVLGRGKSTSHRIESNYVSDVHVRFQLHPNKASPGSHILWAFDYSKNGSAVNGHKIRDLVAAGAAAGVDGWSSFRDTPVDPREWPLADGDTVTLTPLKKTGKDAVAFIVRYVAAAPAEMLSVDEVMARAQAVDNGTGKRKQGFEPDARIPDGSGSPKRAKIDDGKKMPLRCTSADESSSSSLAGPKMVALRNMKCDTLPPLADLFAGNSIERSFLVASLKAMGILLEDVWDVCREHLVVTRDWDPREGRSAQRNATAPLPIDPAAVTWDTECTADGWSAVFGGLLYHYRRAMPSANLHPKITRRADCWYGIDCRTQRHKEGHAEKLNHVCPNTKKG